MLTTYLSEWCLTLWDADPCSYRLGSLPKHSCVNNLPLRVMSHLVKTLNIAHTGQAAGPHTLVLTTYLLEWCITLLDTEPCPYRSGSWLTNSGVDNLPSRVMYHIVKTLIGPHTLLLTTYLLMSCLTLLDTKPCQYRSGSCPTHSGDDNLPSRKLSRLVKTLNLVHTGQATGHTFWCWELTF